MKNKKQKERVVTRSFTLDEDHYKKLRRIGYGNASKGLRIVLIEYKGIIPKELPDNI